MCKARADTQSLSQKSHLHCNTVRGPSGVVEAMVISDGFRGLAQSPSPQSSPRGRGGKTAFLLGQAPQVCPYGAALVVASTAPCHSGPCEESKYLSEGRALVHEGTALDSSSLRSSESSMPVASGTLKDENCQCFEAILVDVGADVCLPRVAIHAGARAHCNAPLPKEAPLGARPFSYQ